MRLFIAVDISEEAKQELLKAQQQLPKGKLSLAKDFHITLKFLGEVQESKAEELKQKLKEVKMQKIAASLSGIGVFPNENYIRVVWAGVEPADEIIGLQQQIDNIIGKEYPDDHKFSPHLTLARVKSADDKKEFAKQLKEIKIEKTNFEIDSFKLKKSTLSPKGAVHEDLAVFFAN